MAASGDGAAAAGKSAATGPGAEANAPAAPAAVGVSNSAALNSQCAAVVKALGLGHFPETEEELREAIALIKGNAYLPRPPKPTPPAFRAETPIRRRLGIIQRYINSFEYNHTGTVFFNIRRDAGLQRINLQAKLIMREALPIQCVEALFVAVCLTSGPEFEQVIRMPVSFKSVVDGSVFKHIVLAVGYKGKWGALGISRKRTLMYKDLVYPTFAKLIAEYKKRYEECFHKLVKVYVGLPFASDQFVRVKLLWRVCRVCPEEFPWETVSAVLNKYATAAPSIFAAYQMDGVLNPTYKSSFVLIGGDNDSDVESGHACLSSAEAAAIVASEAAKSKTSTPTKRGGSQRPSTSSGGRHRAAKSKRPASQGQNSPTKVASSPASSPVRRPATAGAAPATNNDAGFAPTPAKPSSVRAKPKTPTKGAKSKPSTASPTPSRAKGKGVDAIASVTPIVTRRHSQTKSTAAAKKKGAAGKASAKKKSKAKKRGKQASRRNGSMPRLQSVREGVAETAAESESGADGASSSSEEDDEVVVLVQGAAQSAGVDKPKLVMSPRALAVVGSPVTVAKSPRLAATVADSEHPPLLKTNSWVDGRGGGAGLTRRSSQQSMMSVSSTASAGSHMLQALRSPLRSPRTVNEEGLASSVSRVESMFSISSAVSMGGEAVDSPIEDDLSLSSISRHNSLTRQSSMSSQASSVASAISSSGPHSPINRRVSSVVEGSDLEGGASPTGVVSTRRVVTPTKLVIRKSFKGV